MNNDFELLKKCLILLNFYSQKPQRYSVNKLQLYSVVLQVVVSSFIKYENSNLVFNLCNILKFRNYQYTINSFLRLLKTLFDKKKQTQIRTYIKSNRHKKDEIKVFILSTNKDVYVLDIIFKLNSKNLNQVFIYFINTIKQFIYNNQFKNIEFKNTIINILKNNKKINKNKTEDEIMLMFLSLQLDNQNKIFSF